MPFMLSLTSMAKTKTAAEPKTDSKRKADKSAVSTPSTPKETHPPHIVRYCSFCGKSSETRKRLIAGPNNIFLCDECLEVCIAILLIDNKDEWTLRLENLLKGKKRFNIEIDKTKPVQKKGKKGNA